MAQTIGGIAGAAIGFAIGGPAGAQWGWAIGAAVGNSFTTIKQPRIGDLANVTAGEGGARARTYGTFRPIGGQVVWSGKPREIRTRQRSGKGGPKVETSTVLRSYAIGICEGPITSVSRIWRNNELVYDVRPGSLIVLESTKWLEAKNIVLGDWEQLPHPTIESESGAANAPAMRGTAYLMVTDEDLTDLRGAIPAYQFEVGGGSSSESYATWDAANLIGPGALEGGALTFFNNAASNPATAENDATTGHARVRSTAAITGPAKFYFECYSTMPAGATATPQQGLRVGLARKDFALTQGNGGNDSLLFESNWKRDFIGKRGMYQKGGGINAQNAGPAGVTASQWCGIAVEATGSIATTLDVKVWMIVDGNWSFDGQNPSNTPAGSTILSGSFNSVNALGGICAMASLYRPRAFVSESEIVGNFGQSAFQISPEVFSAGGELEGFTPGWLNSGPSVPGGPGTLKAIVASICQDASLEPDKVDVSALPDVSVPGFATSPDYSAVEAIRELAKVYFFDLQDADGKVKFVPRGGNFARTIDEGVFVSGEDEPETDTTRDSLSVPRLLHLSYFDVSGGQGTDKQFSERQISPRAESPTVLSTPAVLTAETAARGVRVQHQVMEEELRGELVFGVSDQLINLAPADVIVVQYRGRSQRCRITKLELMDGWQRITAVRDRQSAYSATVQAIPPAVVTLPPSTIVGATRFAFLDIPALTQAGDVLSYHVATSGEVTAWRGAVIEREEAGAQFAVLATDGTGTVMGALTTALPLASEFYPDNSNVLRVQLARSDDELEGVSNEVWLSRANAAALVRADGTAEIVQFRDAVEESPGVWALSGLQRGRLNSGASAHSIGAVFVLLDGALLVQAGTERLATTINHRAYSFGNNVSTATAQARTWTGRSQREWPPIIETAARVADTMNVTWTPRHRFGSDEFPVPSAQFIGWNITATSGANSVSADTVTPTAALNVTGFSNPITVTVRGRNRLTGNGDAATRIVP